MAFRWCNRSQYGVEWELATTRLNIYQCAVRHSPFAVMFSNKGLLRNILYVLLMISNSTQLLLQIQSVPNRSHLTHLFNVSQFFCPQKLHVFHWFIFDIKELDILSYIFKSIIRCLSIFSRVCCKLTYFSCCIIGCMLNTS